MAVIQPILVIDDDIDDHEIIGSILEELNLKREVIFFTNCVNAFKYLLTTNNKPAVIICDINLPVMDGYTFKKELQNTAFHDIPFYFFSTSSNERFKASELANVSGYFVKGTSYSEMKKAVASMVASVI